MLCARCGVLGAPSVLVAAAPVVPRLHICPQSSLGPSNASTPCPEQDSKTACHKRFIPTICFLSSCLVWQSSAYARCTVHRPRCARLGCAWFVGRCAASKCCSLPSLVRCTKALNRSCRAGRSQLPSRHARATHAGHEHARFLCSKRPAWAAMPSLAPWRRQRLTLHRALPSCRFRPCLVRPNIPMPANTRPLAAPACRPWTLRTVCEP